jgi:hypothetical protein
MIYEGWGLDKQKTGVFRGSRRRDHFAGSNFITEDSE